MKKVQIDYELFRKLIFYHLGSDDQYEEDMVLCQDFGQLKYKNFQFLV